MKLFNKIKFLFQRPKVVIITGRGSKTAKEAILKVLKPYFKIGKEILILEEIEDFRFLIKYSRLPVLLVTHLGEYHPEKEFFVGSLEEAAEIRKLTEALPAFSHLILNFDDETVRNLKEKNLAHLLTFGFGLRADIRASDVVLTESPILGTNFKINYQGKIVPIWREKLFGKEQIYAALAAAAVGEVLGLNLVEISEALR